MLITYSIVRAKFNYWWLMFLSSRNKFDCQLQMIIPLSFNLSSIFFETNYSETETFFPRPKFPKQKTRLFFQDQIFRNWNQDPKKIDKSPETENSWNKNITLCLCGLEGDDYDMMKIIAIMVIMMLISTFTRKDFQIPKRQYLCKDYQNIWLILPGSHTDNGNIAKE